MKDIKIFPRRKKGKKQQYGREQYKSLPEDEKQKLVDYRKKKEKLPYYSYNDEESLLRL